MWPCLRNHAFSLFLFAAVGLAVVFPEPASTGGLLHSEWISGIGVAVIFFLQGLSLPTQSLAAGYKPIRLHLFVLSWNFLWFPAVAALLLYPMTWFLPNGLLLGFGVLAFLPTTIASATAYTALSGGTVGNAIVSTVLSNLLAVFLVPTILVAYFEMESSVEISLGAVFLSLVYMLVLPLALGQIARKYVFPSVDRSMKVSKRISAGIILFIVYLAFAQSMESGILGRLSLESLGVLITAVVLLLLATSALVWKSTYWLQIESSQRIAAFFCASQKSLASGLPLISSILLVVPDVAETTVILLPLLCFHPLQMLLAGVLSDKFSQYYGKVMAINPFLKNTK